MFSNLRGGSMGEVWWGKHGEGSMAGEVWGGEYDGGSMVGEVFTFVTLYN